MHNPHDNGYGMNTGNPVHVKHLALTSAAAAAAVSMLAGAGAAGSDLQAGPGYEAAAVSAPNAALQPTSMPQLLAEQLQGQCCLQLRPLLCGCHLKVLQVLPLHGHV